MAVAVTTVAFGFNGQVAERRYEDRIKYRPGGSVAVSAKSVEALETGDALRAGWAAFAQREGGHWAIYLDERTGLPTVATGRIGWFDGEAAQAELDLDRLESRARDFLARNTSVLGNWARELVLDRDASGESEHGKWQLVFRQQRDGVRVDNARFTFHVIQGNLVQFGASRIAPIAVPGTPKIQSGAAVRNLWSYLGVDGSGHTLSEEPELALVAIDPVRGASPSAWSGARGEGVAHALIWRIPFTVDGESTLWQGEVDALSGEVLTFEDATHYTSIQGGVYPTANDEDCPSGGCEVNAYPMPFAAYFEGFNPNTSIADEFGNFTCNDPTDVVTTRLRGPYVGIVDTCGQVLQTRPCSGDLALELKNGENCTGNDGGNTGASRSAFYHVNRVAQMARSYLPGNTFINTPVTVNTNITQTCNATWSGQINMYNRGGGCGNTGENAGVLTHEWGHGFDQNDGGGFDRTSEAYADTVAVFYSRESCVGRGFFLNGTCSGYGDNCLSCTGIRDHDWAARAANTPATPSTWVQNRCGGGGSSPCGRSVHCESYPIVESVFDLATRDLPAMGIDPDSAWQLAERLWYESRDGSGGDIYNCSLPDSDSCGATSWYQRMRVADDDDGDLSNGTPHAAALFAAFDRHDIACGAAADLENQNTSTCPALTQPGIAVAREEEGTRIDWTAVPNADSYIVFRADRSCDVQHVNIGSVPAGTTTFVDTAVTPGFTAYYRVQAVGANPTCRGAVSECAVNPSGVNLIRQRVNVVDTPLGNGDGVLDAGETARIPVTLFNSGVEDATGVSARLRAVDRSEVRVIVADAAYPNIAAKTEAGSGTDFEIVVQPGVACPGILSLSLEMNADDTPTSTASMTFGLGEVCPVATCDDAVPGETFGLRVDRSGSDLVFSWDENTEAAGYFVLSDDAPQFGDDDVAGRTDGAISLTIPGAAASGPSIEFFKVRGVNSCNWEGP
ncbi:hypothetical protein ABI59_19685 [Acidobacteria bacterium Mor1]|nr:hypothetical protein ABI59_19685 [Acidobacteria bacterium Mor1]